jgi:predicted ATPase
MLINWTVANFKSIGQQLTLPLSPITVLVGANSSGKSSIIQSILLIKQTLQYATADRPIALNGPLLKLGNFNDIKNVLSKGEGFLIGWRYDAGYFSSIFPDFPNEINSNTPIYSPYRGVVSEIDCETRFGVDANVSSELSLLQPKLISCAITAAVGASETPGTARVEVRRTDVPADDVFAKRVRPIPYAARPTDAQYYEVSDIDIETNASILEDHPEGKIVGAVVRHFLPFSIAVKFDNAKRKATQIADAICTLRNTIRFQREYAGLTAPPDLLILMDEWLKVNAEFFPNQLTLFAEDAKAHPTKLSDIVTGLQNLQRRARYRSPTLSFPSLQELQPKIVEILTENFPSEYDVELERPRLIYDATIQTREYFENYVRYLGPLRDEPKPLYPLEALGNPTDVGYRGEHTAAVLHLNQFRTISYVPSKTFRDSTIDASSSTFRTEAFLRSAVEDWLSYMGVVEGISTGDRGKIGHELQVKTPGMDKFHDLTNVGVGVSQVLPIILMALLAVPGSLLIFEQPELHLHPLVQTRLADFFIAMALSGKQCLLETHSEYLIHRLRRRIAEAPGEALTNLCRLYFVERAGGQTSCRQVDITRYGAILDWPIDFFDQSQVEAERILSAASAKRASERQSRTRTKE